MNKKITWITRTAIFIALLFVIQFATSFLNNTIITGSLVNLTLIVSLITCGFSSGMTVAILSPVIAKLGGIGPLWSLTPFIIAGNISFIISWFILKKKKSFISLAYNFFTIITAALIKFIVLYVGIVLFAIPILLNLPPQQAAIISSLFSIPQFISAFIGGGLAIVILPVLLRATTGSDRQPPGF